MMTQRFVSVAAMILSCVFVLLLHSQSVTADTILPPRISTPQKTIRVKEWQTKVLLECNLEVGDDPMAYRWLKQYKLVTADLGFAYRTRHKVHLALHTITRQHGGIYECEAANDAGVDATRIEVIVEPGDYFRHVGPNKELPDTSEVLSELAASLNDMLAEGDCTCDIMFLLHVSPDAPPQTVAAQANFVHTVATSIISDKVRIAAATYSDYLNFKLSFGKGVNPCALTNALKSLDHEKWSTRIQGVLRDALKRFRKSKKECKALFFPIFGSLGTEGANSIVSKHLKKLGVKIFILEVTESPLAGVQEMASQRGDGKPYHWWIPMKIWPTIVSYMAYMPEELSGCSSDRQDIEGVCVSAGWNCTKSSQCQGIGFGCVQGTCKSLECNINPSLTGCCSSPGGEFWCGDVTMSCQPSDALCDGELQCMNGLDEERCWNTPCEKDEARCQSSTRCLSMYDLCDGEPHCPRAEDEDPKFCRSFPCPSDRPFRCRNGKCISTNNLCDGTFRDCEDGEDENLEYCSERHVCPPTRPFKCDYGICMPERMVCDGAFNCLDALDERLCKERNCPADRPFKCGDGTCVELSLVCNGVIDACDDGMDEYNCTEFICPSGRSFKCLNGKCIDDWLTCDKRDDCGDNTDEAQCDSPPTSTTPPSFGPKPTKASCLDDEFYCTSGACLPTEKVCDGRRNCIDGEDEDEELCRNYPCPSQRSFRCPDGACVNVNFCDGVPDCADAFDEEDCFSDIDEDDYVYEDHKKDYDPTQLPDDDHDEHMHKGKQPPLQESHPGTPHDGGETLPEIEDEENFEDDSVEVMIDGEPADEVIPSPPASSVEDDDEEPTTNLDDAMLVTKPEEEDEMLSGSGSHGNTDGVYFSLFFWLPFSLITFYQPQSVSFR